MTAPERNERILVKNKKNFKLTKGLGVDFCSRIVYSREMRDTHHMHIIETRSSPSIGGVSRNILSKYLGDFWFLDMEEKCPAGI